VWSRKPIKGLTIPGHSHADAFLKATIAAVVAGPCGDLTVLVAFADVRFGFSNQKTTSIEFLQQ
jgi:hypothetical protein